MNIQKVVVVGTGMVGSSYAYSLVNQNIVDELVLIDLNKESAKANADDIIHGTCFLERQPMIYAGEYSDCKDADVVCITAGAAQKPGQTRLELVGINTKIMEGIIDEVMASGFDGILLIASNPVDVMSLVAQKRSKLPKNRVIGSGTTLDTGRFRNNLAEYLNYNPTNIHGYIIGEHGDSSVPLWSTATVGQKPILDVIAQSNGKFNMEKANECFIEARDAAYKIIEGKGSTYYGIGIALAKVTKAILTNQRIILPVSSLLEGEFEQNGLYVAVPTLVGREGAIEVQDLKISADEQYKFNLSCDQLKTIIESIGYDKQ